MAMITAVGKRISVYIKQVVRPAESDRDPDSRVRVTVKVELDGRERYLNLQYFQQDPKRSPFLEQREVLLAMLRYGNAVPAQEALQTIVDYVLTEAERKEYVYK